MDILQNIKGFLSRYFPLHLNATVAALEDSLYDAESKGWYHQLHVEMLKGDLEIQKDISKVLTDTNNQFRKDNTWLTGQLGEARQFIRVVQQELDDVYSSMTPKLARWPVPVSAQLEDDKPYGSFIRVELPVLRLQCMVNEAVRSGLYKGYVESFSDSIATTAYKEVKDAVADILNNLPPVTK